jgi:hypothetical protein
LLPNDVGLFRHWHNALMCTGNVTIWLNSEVINMNSYNDSKLINEIIVIKEGKMTEIKNSTYIFAIPPKNFINILISNKLLKNAFGNFNEYAIWQKNTEYLLFIITTPTKRSTYLNKIPDECGKDELINEVFRQLRTVYPNLPIFNSAFLSPEMFKKQNKWMSRDSAYVRTKDEFKNAQSVEFKNLYSVGTHNGNHFYNFTSIESATSNAVALLNDLIPESKKKYKIISFITVKHIVTFIGIILMLYILYKISKSKTK